MNIGMTSQLRIKDFPPACQARMKYCKGGGKAPTLNEMRVFGGQAQL
jgi:hypothetical protein